MRCAELGLVTMRPGISVVAGTATCWPITVRSLKTRWAAIGMNTVPSGRRYGVSPISDSSGSAISVDAGARGTAARAGRSAGAAVDSEAGITRSPAAAGALVAAVSVAGDCSLAAASRTGTGWAGSDGAGSDGAALASSVGVSASAANDSGCWSLTPRLSSLTTYIAKYSDAVSLVSLKDAAARGDDYHRQNGSHGAYLVPTHGLCRVSIASTGRDRYYRGDFDSDGPGV